MSMFGGLAGLAGMLNSTAGRTIGGALLTGMGAIGQGIGNLGARLQNQRRYTQGLGLLNTGFEQTQPIIRDLASNIGGQYGQQPGDIFNAYTNLYNPILDSMQGNNAQINAQFQDRLNTGLGMIQGAGAQERIDINRQFDQSGAAQMADLASRGLMGSTITSGVNAQNERGRADSLGGLNERLLQQRLGVYTGLSGDALSQQIAGNNQYLGARATFGQNTLGQYFGSQNTGLAAQLGLGMMPVDNYNSYLNNTLNWIGNRTDLPPDSSAFYNMAASLGRGSVQPAQAPSADWLGPTIGAVGNVAGLGLLGYGLAGGFGGSMAGFSGGPWAR